ncbi:unnamed protein product, partial [Callosobruchus maculatus]
MEYCSCAVCCSCTRRSAQGVSPSHEDEVSLKKKWTFPMCTSLVIYHLHHGRTSSFLNQRKCKRYKFDCHSLSFQSVVS